MNPCKICKTPTDQIISFGQMPIANNLVDSSGQNEFLYEMEVVFCPECYMVQLKDTVPPESMFNDQYPYISSMSKFMIQHFKNVADEIILATDPVDDPFVVELGCNDGIMLQHLKKQNIRHLGIEPSGNVADMAKKNGINVTKEFFNKDLAEQIVDTYGRADVIYGANVFNHIEDLNSVLHGVSALLKPNGICIIEDPYIYDILNKSSFDQIYDEHIYFFSGLSIRELSKFYDLQLYDMKPQNVHGGSMRYYIQKGKERPISDNVGRLILKEQEASLDQFAGYQTFKDSINNICSELRSLLQNIKSEGNRIVGYGATAKSSTLLNYCKIGPDTLEYICDTTPNKINKLTPGMHIPIVPYEQFCKDDIRHVLLLAWNHKDEIFKKEEKFRNEGGKFIIYFPKIRLE